MKRTAGSSPRLESPLEQMVEVAAYADRSSPNAARGGVGRVTLAS